MRQEIQVTTVLTYDAPARLSKPKLQTEIENDVCRLLDADSDSKVECTGYKIGVIREEAEIYGNEPSPLDALRNLLDTMESPRSRKATNAWVVARRIVGRGL